MKTPRPCHPPRFRVVWVSLLSLAGAIAFTSCKTEPGRPSVARSTPYPASPHLFPPTEFAVAVAALREWHATLADPQSTYELDAFDRRIGRRLRQAVGNLFPPLPVPIDREDPARFTVAIERVELPQGNYAYATLRVASQFETAEHAYVYEYGDPAWVLLDHYLIANSKMEAVLTDFSWSAYCREKGITEATGTVAR